MLDRRRRPSQYAYGLIYLHHALFRQLQVIKVCRNFRKIRETLKGNHTFANNRPRLISVGF